MSRRVVLSVLALSVAALAAAVVLAPAGRADGERPHGIVYVNVSGDGPNSKAWYRGAPPAGVTVQEALDTFARDGYRVASVVAGTRAAIQTVSTVATSPPVLIPDQQYLILLER